MEKRSLNVPFNSIVESQNWESTFDSNAPDLNYKRLDQSDLLICGETGTENGHMWLSLRWSCARARALTYPLALQDSGIPDSFPVYHYNGLKQSNHNEKVTRTHNFSHIMPMHIIHTPVHISTSWSAWSRPTPCTTLSLGFKIWLLKRCISNPFQKPTHSSTRLLKGQSALSSFQRSTDFKATPLIIKWRLSNAQALKDP